VTSFARPRLSLLLVAQLAFIAAVASADRAKKTPRRSRGKAMKPKSSSRARAPGKKFTMRYSVRGGRKFADGLQQRDSELYLDSAAGTVTYRQHRSASDQAGEAIGRFAIPLDAAAARRIRSLLESDAFDKLEPGGKGHLSSSNMVFDVHLGDRRLQRGLNSGDLDKVDSIQSLLEEINDLLYKLLQHPTAAIRAEVKFLPGGKDGDPRFELIITNVGKKPVYIGDPRLLPAEVHRWAGAWVGERPSYGRPSWARIPLAPPPEGASTAADIRLEPGKRFSARTKPWKPPKPGIRYLIKGVLMNYEGPAEVKGVYRVRGAVFSKRVDFAPK
jgi:hypothetical protein